MRWGFTADDDDDDDTALPQLAPRHHPRLRHRLRRAFRRLVGVPALGARRVGCREPAVADAVLPVEVAVLATHERAEAL